MTENKPIPTSWTRGRRAIKTIAVMFFVSAVLLTTWTLLMYTQYSLISTYSHARIQLGISTFQIEIVLAGLTGLLTSLFLKGRRRSKNTQPSPLKMTPMSFGTGKAVHPLMMTQRPARDNKFVIRKTRNRGRISRNRMGERLPPSNVAEAE